MPEFRPESRFKSDLCPSPEQGSSPGLENQSAHEPAGGHHRPPWMDYFVAQFEDTVDHSCAAEEPLPDESGFRLEDLFGPEEPSPIGSESAKETISRQELPVNEVNGPAEQVREADTSSAGPVEQPTSPTAEQFDPSANADPFFPPLPATSVSEKPEKLVSVLDIARPLQPAAADRHTDSELHPAFKAEELASPALNESSSFLGNQTTGHRPRRHIRRAGWLITAAAVLVASGVALRTSWRNRPMMASLLSKAVQSGHTRPKGSQTPNPSAQTAEPSQSPVAATAGGPPAEVESVEFKPTSEVVTISGQGELKYQDFRISGPDRIYLDLPNTRLSSELMGKSMKFNDPLLTKIRIAEHEPGTARVTLETKAHCRYSVSSSTDLRQLTITLKQSSTPHDTGIKAP
jgi:AMIN domain-containing protein